MPLFPAFLDLSEETVLVVGQGPEDRQAAAEDRKAAGHFPVFQPVQHSAQGQLHGEGAEIIQEDAAKIRIQPPQHGPGADAVHEKVEQRIQARHRWKMGLRPSKVQTYPKIFFSSATISWVYCPARATSWESEPTVTIRPPSS